MVLINLTLNKIDQPHSPKWPFHLKLEEERGRAVFRTLTQTTSVSLNITVMQHRKIDSERGQWRCVSSRLWLSRVCSLNAI